eukprot:Partr_v1_DN28897_c2_g1_i1_m34057
MYIHHGFSDIALQITHHKCCLAKVLSYGQYPQANIERVIDIVNSCFIGEATNERVLIQSFKVLQEAVSYPSVHDALLLMIVRTAYNIFLLSKKGRHHSVAQSILSQMILLIFGRIALPTVASANSLEMPVQSSYSLCRSIVDGIISSIPLSGDSSTLSSKQAEPYLRDGYLVFRALCRLSLKPLPELNSSKREIHQVALRSKILSLELLSVIVREHFSVICSDVQIGETG